MATILPFIQRDGGTFDETATRVMGAAFDAACEGLGDIGQLAREVIAERIIAAAKSGERDPARLREAALEAFKSHSEGIALQSRKLRC
jgi:hypothetical protein